MSETKFTPPKWRIVPLRRYGMDIYSVQTEHAEKGTRIVAESASREKAHLIASAPSMYEALEASQEIIARLLFHGTAGIKASDKARLEANEAALASARGEAK